MQSQDFILDLSEYTTLTLYSTLTYSTTLCWLHTTIVRQLCITMPALKYCPFLPDASQFNVLTSQRGVFSFKTWNLMLHTTISLQLALTKDSPQMPFSEELFHVIYTPPVSVPYFVTGKRKWDWGRVLFALWKTSYNLDVNMLGISYH